MLALGGWSFGSQPFQDLTSNQYRMNGFVYDSLEFLRTHEFDGLDIDWEVRHSKTELKKDSIVLWNGSNEREREIAWIVIKLWLDSTTMITPILLIKYFIVFLFSILFFSLVLVVSFHLHSSSFPPLQYPRGADDKANYVNFVKELRLAFEGEASSTGHSRLLLSAAVPASFEALAAG